MIAILIPVLDRPARVRPLVASLEASGQAIDLNPVFLLTPGDRDERRAVKGSGARGEVMEFGAGQGDYARKMNWGIRNTDDPFIFLAADDLIFHPGWAERAIACWYETHACVVGTNDLGNDRVVSGQHSTHTLVHRDYLECGGADSPELLHEGYWHNFVDDEFVQLAQARGTYAHAGDSRVEHLHPNWGKAGPDATYSKGMLHFNEDRNLFQRRRRIWSR